MTYGPVHKWSVPFFGTLDSRKPVRTVFICLAALVGLGIFSYWACGLPSTRFHFSSDTLVTAKTDQHQQPLRRDAIGVQEENLKIKPGLVDRLVLAPAKVPRIYPVIEQVDKKDVSNTKVSFSISEHGSTTKDLRPSTSEFNPSTQINQLEGSDEYSVEDKGSGLPNGSTTYNGKVEISWDDPRLDILHMPKPEFNPKFKNPCWYEPLHSPDPYQDNAYVLYSSAAKETLAKLTERWEELYDREEEPKRLRCLPYFMIIGQPKCGSTDLFWKVAKHPDIDTPPIKELHWWARNRQGRRFSNTRIIPYEDYVDMFDKAALKIEGSVFNGTRDIVQRGIPPNTQVVTGEASVSLLWDNNDWPKLPENRDRQEPQYVNPHYVHHLIPDVKLIVILRDPIERMYSDYLYFHSSNKSSDDFHEAVRYAISCHQNCSQKHSLRHCVYSLAAANRARIRLRVGLYSVFLKDWFSVFPQQQFYILRLEDYSKDSLKHIKEIYRFLDLRETTPEEDETILESPRSNVRKTKDKELGRMHEATRKLLKDFYQPFNIELAKLLQDKKYLWLDKD